MSDFPHLKFKEKLTGTPRFGRNISNNDRTQSNKDNRVRHSTTLGNEATLVYNAWFAHVETREAQGLASLDLSIQPIYLEINPSLIDSELEADLLSFGIEIISQEEDGFILGASLDNLTTLKDKISGFATEDYGTGNIANFYKITTGDHSAWKPQAILAGSLLDDWQTIPNEVDVELEVSIAFGVPTPKQPNQTKHRGLASRNQKYEDAIEDRDKKQMEREAHFQDFIQTYGEITSPIVDLEDSLGCEVKISGKGLKDLIINYPFVFDIKYKDEISGGLTDENVDYDVDLVITPPEENSPVIGVIDSGIMEQHRFLTDSITPTSISYIPGDTDVGDKVNSGGHGTRVAGAILFPRGVSGLASPYKLPLLIRNLRVLNSNNKLLNPYPPKLMEDIVNGNVDVRIFNLSINSKAPFRLKHMSTWAAMLDKLIYQQNVLFINSVGNIKREDIRYHIQNGTAYPNYLEFSNYRLANPAQSSFSIVVGSVNHIEFDTDVIKTLGLKDEVSAYSRIGPGIWDHIKPDVVEYGGGMQISKDGHALISNKDTSTELIRATNSGGPAYGKDCVGSSYAAPKVSSIVGELAKIYPKENINLWRALLIQGARLPKEHFESPSILSLRHFGYGIPSLVRVTENNEYRATFYVADSIIAKEGKIYTVSIPDQMRDPGDEYDVLIEVTLAYTAKTRRTRQKTNSYVGTWLDWDNAKLGEPYSEFKDYTLKVIDGEETSYDSNKRITYDSLQWKFGKQSNQGLNGLRRGNSTIQKDYCIIKSYRLPDELSFVVHAHNGWDKNNDPVPFALAVSFEILGQDIPIYHELKVENEIDLEVE